jgi:hypothetical protein
VVDLEAKRQHFIDKAKEAEDDASNAPDVDTKETWLRIAEQYRMLAEVIHC